jgi:cysteine-rich repeat protein
MRGILAAFLPLAACGLVDTRQPPGPDPGEIAAAIDDALAGLGTGTTIADEIAYRVYDLRDTQLTGTITPETCDSVDNALDQTCVRLTDYGQHGNCGRQTTFYYAHAVPRCAVRLWLHEYAQPADYDTNLPWIYALDFTGTPLTGPEPQCGNGAVDDGEQCDDGNFELWDGCDASCKIEEFTGCEAVIEQAYAFAGLAFVDRTTWQTRRSQLMVNTASAQRAVTADTCAEAGAVAIDVCSQLQAQMPFVQSCARTYRYDDAGAAPSCAVRFEVHFNGRSPDDGVFTTALTGLLTFTIR